MINSDQSSNNNGLLKTQAEAMAQQIDMMEIASKSSKFGAARMRHRSSPDRLSSSSPTTTARDEQTFMKRQLSSSPRHTKLSLSRATQFSQFISDQNHNLSYRGGYSTSTKLLALLISLVICVWIAMISIMMFHVTYYQDYPVDNKLPIPLSTVRHHHDEVITHTNHHLRREKQHNIINKLPKNYFQLSPPTSKTATKSIHYDSGPPWSWPIIHIVTTRFMQGQGTLINLARSRLKLLEVILLPSLLEQTIFELDTLYEVYESTKWEEEIDMLSSKHHHVSIDPNFLWIIKVDPNLDKTVLNELKAVLEPVKHFTLVVGSNTNFGIGVKPGGFRGGQAGQDILHAYENGNLYFPESLHNNDNAYETFRRAHEARNDRVVLETRIDSDDAVNVDYFATLQNIAIRTLVDRNVSEYDESKDTKAESTSNDNKHEPSKNVESKQTQQTAKWLYWCPQTHVQWNPSSEHQGAGMLQVFQMPNTCVTAGLTLGFAIGSKEENVPRYPHDKIYWEIVIHHNNEKKVNNTTLPAEAAAAAVTDEADIHHCGLYPSSQCAVFVTDPHVSAFRSRAMTSAGMHNIEANGEPSVKTPQKYKDYAADLWRGTIEKQFGIKTEKAKEAADFMLENYLGTVRDNLKGQCTHGHSCKESSLEKLQRTIDILEEEIGGIKVKESKN